MKKYIRASFSESTPSWLLQDFNRKHWNNLKNRILDKYHIALDKVQYSDNPTSNSIPIYLLQTDYGNTVYCPGANDDETILINGRQRKLGSIAKSKLPEMAIDTVYIELSGDNVAPRKDRYRDPRRTYRYGGPDGKYAGQYRKTKYDRETDQDLPDGWSNQGLTPANESRARDKSGYKIPSPEEKLEQYYTQFPEKITSKIDALYDKLIETRQMLLDADFNSPIPDYRSDETNIDYSKAYRRFADAVNDYRQLLTDMNSDSRFADRSASRFARAARQISERVDEIQKILAGEDVW